MSVENQREKGLSKKIKNLYIGNVANKLVYEAMEQDMPNFWNNDWNPHPIIDAHKDNDDDWEDYNDEENDKDDWDNCNDEEIDIEFYEDEDDFYRDKARDILIAEKYFELYKQGNAIIREDLQNWIEYKLSVEYKYDEWIPAATDEEMLMIEDSSELTLKQLAFERADFLTQDFYPEREENDLYYELQLVIKDINLQWNAEEEQRNGSMLILLYDCSYENEWIVRLVFASYEKMGLTLLVQKYCDNKAEFDALLTQLNSIKKEEDSILQFVKKFAAEYIKKEREGKLKEKEYVHNGKLIEKL